jgi:hypothetical protein
VPGLTPVIVREEVPLDVPPGVPTTLRPLGIGELLDRAVTLCVRHFWALAAIYVGFAALLELVQVLGGNDRAQLVAALTQLARNQAAGRADDHALAHVFSQYAPAGGWTLAALALAIFVLPLPTAAMAASASAFYLGGALNLGDAYRAAVRVWPQLLMVIVIYLAAGSVAYVAVFLVALALIFLVVLVAAASKMLAIALGIALSLAFFVLAIAAGLLAGLAYQVSFCTCVLEGATFLVAFGRGLRRVFRGVGLRRSLLAGLAYFAVLLGITMVSAIGQGVLLGLIKSSVLGSVFAVIVNVAAGAFATVFLVLFYYDLRVREEGFDLQAVANALPADLFPAG